VGLDPSAQKQNKTMKKSVTIQQLFGFFRPFHKSDKCTNRLTLNGVWASNHSSLSDQCMLHQRTLYLGSSDTMTTHIQDIIATTRNKQVSILVTVHCITCEIEPGIRLKICGHVSLVVSQAGSRHARPWLTDSEHALDIITFDDFPSSSI